MTHTDFSVAYGSTIGRDHRSVQKNCQDGFHVITTDACTVGVVTDGCGSGQYSEVGAKIGARLVATAVASEIQRKGVMSLNWTRIQKRVLSQLTNLAWAMGDDFSAIVQEYFLFTVVGVALDDQQALFFALGDGVIVINGETLPLGPFPGNMPPYIGYGMLGDDSIDDSLTDVMRPVALRSLDELENFLIGCDGVLDLMLLADRTLPGSPDMVGDISQFWQDDRYFRGNPELVSRRLKLISRDWPRREPQPGLLPDDTTLIVGRRNPPVLDQTQEG